MQRLTTYNIYGSMTYTSWSSDFALYLENYLMEVMLWIIDQCDTKIDLKKCL